MQDAADPRPPAGRTFSGRANALLVFWLVVVLLASLASPLQQVLARLRS